MNTRIERVVKISTILPILFIREIVQMSTIILVPYFAGEYIITGKQINTENIVNFLEFGTKEIVQSIADDMNIGINFYNNNIIY